MVKIETLIDIFLSLCSLGVLDILLKVMRALNDIICWYVDH